MVWLSALVFALAWWMGLYLLSRDARKPVLVLAAIGLCGFATVVALDAVRAVGGAHHEGYAEALSRIEIYLVAVPGIAWFAVVLELARPGDTTRTRTRELILTALVAAAVLAGAALAGSVNGPLRLGHWLMFSVISVSTLGAMVAAVRRPAQPARVAGVVAVATLFFALGNAIIVIPLGLVPSWLALAATGCDVLLLGVAVALWDAFDEGQLLRAAMLRSFIGSLLTAVVLVGQLLIVVAVTNVDGGGRVALTALVFSTLAVSIAVTVLADPLAGLLDRVAFSRSPDLRADRAALRTTEAALPLRSPNPLDDLDDETFARLTRRALGHYGDLAKLVASPLNRLPEIDERLARRGAPDQPSRLSEQMFHSCALLAEFLSRRCCGSGSVLTARGRLRGGGLTRTPQAGDRVTGLSRRLWLYHGRNC